MARLATGTQYQVLVTGGAGANPSWDWAALEYQTQTGTWADPTGSTYNGRVVLVYNSTLGEYRLYTYMNTGWRSVELIG